MKGDPCSLDTKNHDFQVINLEYGNKYLTKIYVILPERDVTGFFLAL